MKGLSQIIGQSQGQLSIRLGQLPNTIVITIYAIPKFSALDTYEITKECVVTLGPSHTVNDRLIEESIKAMITETTHAISVRDAC